MGQTAAFKHIIFKGHSLKEFLHIGLGMSEGRSGQPQIVLISCGISKSFIFKVNIVQLFIGDMFVFTFRPK